jgi:aspartyl-tRNA(Asn)/glutamyl-tRNA(Gln) amidotransferase subunit A
MIVQELTLAEAANQVRDGKLSPVELVRASLDRIEALEPKLHAFATVTGEAALEVARTAEQEIRSGRYRGPLHGIPIGIKDLYETRGIPTRAGSKAYADNVPARDSACVEKLAAAGAVMVGKTQTHELAYGVTTPPTRNPWDLGRVPGGSSGGSAAAVSAGECLAAVGTDTAGSIRIPAAVCGVVGVKPTFGRVSRYGVIPLSWSFDHAGPLARTVRDAALVLNAISGHDIRDPSTVEVPVPDFAESLDVGVERLVLALPSNYFFDRVDQEVEHAVRQSAEVFAGLGAQVRTVELPLAEYAFATLFGISLPEASEYHRTTLRERSESLGDDVRGYLELGEMELETQYVRAQRTRQMIKEAWRTALEGIDAVLTPTVPAMAASVGQESFSLPGGDEPVVSAWLRLTCPLNVVGLPAVSIPCGFAGNGLPIGLQIFGRPFQEATVLRIAHAYEASTGWTRRRPSL